MPNVVETARRFRHEARQRGNPARGVLARRYTRVLAQLRRDQAALDRKVAVLKRNGVAVSEALVRQQAEFAAARLRAQNGLLTAADTAMDLLDNEAHREVKLALRDAHELVALRERDLPADRIDATAAANLIGNTDRGPLRQLLRDRAGRDADAVAQLLVDGLVLERDPADTARLITERVQGSSQAAALRLVRTETHRARREACRVVYASTPGCLGWTWICSLRPSSCGLCWAQHGKHFGLNEPMATHPNCTCEVAPWFGEDVDLGVDLFDALTADEQDTAVGPATARAYRAGALTLDQLVGTGRHELWGPVGAQRSLVGVLGDDAARFYRPA